MGGRASPWYPLTSNETQVALAVAGLLGTALEVSGLPLSVVVASIASFLGIAYFAGFLARAASSQFAFVEHAARGGAGYLPYFRRARKSLLLIHVDDDPPVPELTGLYATLLEKGVEIRRLIIRRPEALPEAYDWVGRLEPHPRLIQREVPPPEAALGALSFAIVDESTVLIAVPDVSATEAAPYSSGFFLRHLLVVDDARVAAAFVRVHELLWKRGQGLPAAVLPG